MTPVSGTQGLTGGPEASETLISVSGLCVDYGLGKGAVHAVVDADFTLRPGEVLGLAGESGSGKSTLAYAVTRLLRPPGVITAGQARFGPSVNLLTAGPRQLRGLRWNEIAVVLQPERGLHVVVAGAERDDSGSVRQADAAAVDVVGDLLDAGDRPGREEPHEAVDVARRAVGQP